MGILSLLYALFNILFIVEIVMSSDPKMPMSKFPFVIIYASILRASVRVLTWNFIHHVGGLFFSFEIWCWFEFQERNSFQPTRPSCSFSIAISVGWFFNVVFVICKFLNQSYRHTIGSSHFSKPLPPSLIRHFLKKNPYPPLVLNQQSHFYGFNSTPLFKNT